jgi:hypothetical protein
MFPARWFNPRYWASRFWPKHGEDVAQPLAAACGSITVAPGIVCSQRVAPALACSVAVRPAFAATLRVGCP